MSTAVATRPNVRLLREILADIVLKPKRWYQGAWAERHKRPDGKGWCNTTYCFAGHAVVRAGWRPVWDGDPDATRCRKDGEVKLIEDVAREVLGLTENQAEKLFDAPNDLGDLAKIVTQIEDGELFD